MEIDRLTPSCGQCMYAMRKAGDVFSGMCHFMPPAVEQGRVERAGMFIHHPPVTPSDWCGQFSPVTAQRPWVVE